MLLISADVKFSRQAATTSRVLTISQCSVTMAAGSRIRAVFHMVESIGVIPARFGSTRFPGKALAPLWGKPLVQHVYERVTRCRALERVIVATDDKRVQKAVESFGGTVQMTSSSHQTGTDRVAEIAKSVSAGLFVNIQGDELFVEPEDLARLVEALQSRPELEMATLRFPLSDPASLADPNVVKVVTDARDMALLFSRSPIPFHVEGKEPEDNSPDRGLPAGLHQIHVGVYAYRRQCLLEFSRQPRGRLEQAENLEQLRALELGIRILVLPATGRPRGINTPEDLAGLKEEDLNP